MERMVIDIDYKQVKTEVEDYVVDWLEEAKKKHQIVRTTQYLNWIDDIISRAEYNAISDESDVWYDEWYNNLSKADKYNISCLSKFLDFVYDKAIEQGIESCHNYKIDPSDFDYNPFEITRYYFTHINNLDNFTYCITLMIGQGSAVDIWRINKKKIPKGIKVVKIE